MTHLLIYFFYNIGMVFNNDLQSIDMNSFATWYFVRNEHYAICVQFVLCTLAVQHDFATRTIPFNTFTVNTRTYEDIVFICMSGSFSHALSSDV